MVIVCPECATKFRVAPERIPERGAKVRCARCKHVFLAEKPAPEPVIAEPTVPSTDPAEISDEPAATPPPFPAETDFEPPQKEVEAPREESFSYEKFREMDSEQDDEEDFRFGEEEPGEDIFSQPTEAPVATEEESFSFSGSATADEVETGPSTADEPAEEVADDKVRISSGEVISKEEAYARIFSADDEEQEDADEIASGTEATPAATDQAAARKTPVAASTAKGSPPSSIIRILLLLILGLLILGGALYFINGPEQTEQAIRQILGQVTHQEETGNITLTNLEGKFINNNEAGELFVIRGEALNNYKEPRAAIQVKGVIFDQNGQPLLQKTIFCGNPINDQELQTLPFSKLEERMRNQFGKSLKNMKVNSKETIPFVIAFRDLPNNLAEFSVDIASSEPAEQ